MKQCYQFNNDNEWYTHECDVEYFLVRANIPKDKIIWLPFDKEDSAFVTVFKKYGYKVIYSHIDYNQDFYTYEPEQYDIIISNPPFNGKSKLIERLIQLKKPFALIFGIQCFNTGKFTRLLKQLDRVQMVFLETRISFFKATVPNGRPTFHSMWICNNLFDKDIQIW